MAAFPVFLLTLTLADAKNRSAWQHWRAKPGSSRPGCYEIRVRATNVSGRAQPLVLPGWNAKRCLNNARHRIPVLVA